MERKGHKIVLDIWFASIPLWSTILLVLILSDSGGGGHHDRVPFSAILLLAVLFAVLLLGTFASLFWSWDVLQAYHQGLAAFVACVSMIVLWPLALPFVWFVVAKRDLHSAGGEEVSSGGSLHVTKKMLWLVLGHNLIILAVIGLGVIILPLFFGYSGIWPGPRVASMIFTTMGWMIAGDGLLLLLLAHSLAGEVSSQFGLLKKMFVLSVPVLGLMKLRRSLSAGACDGPRQNKD